MSRWSQVARDLYDLNRRYLKEPSFRGSVRRSAPARPAAAAAAAPRRLPAAAHLYEDLDRSSLALAGLTVGDVTPALNLVVPDIREGAVFAGIRTAVQAGVMLAEELALPLRVVLFNATGSDHSDAAAQWLETEFGPRPHGLSVLALPQLDDLVTSAGDVWVVTYWTTAHAADVATRIGVLDASRVVYLVQDYEAGFHAWGTPFALVRSTYHAGFHLLVNSSPLNNYLVAAEGAGGDEEAVFTPAWDLPRLAAVADAREPSETVRLFFYARPAKPRNLFGLGLSSLKVAVEALAAEGISVEAVSAGESHADVDLGHGVTLRSLGTLSWDGYHDLLSRVDVGLSLQHSPHPSHPPFDLAVSGAWAVTNEFGGTRAHLHPRLLVADADADRLGQALVDAVHRVRAEGTGSLHVGETLGHDIGDSVRHVADKLRH